MTRLAETAIDIHPDGDVVKVIRCKDCIFWAKDRVTCEGVARCETGETGIRFRAPYDFCSRGRREKK